MGMINSNPYHFSKLNEKYDPLLLSPRNRRTYFCQANKVVGIIKLALDAGKANPSPPVGPALGAKGVNIMSFCKEYNAKTADKIGTVIPVEITVFEDKSFTFKLKTPPTSVLIKKEVGLEKGASNPGKQQVGAIKQSQVEKIAATKLID